MSISAHDLRPILLSFFFFNDTATTEIYTLSLHDALPISPTIVATALPFNSQPWKGLFIDLLAPAFLSNTQSRSGSNTVTSASTPTLKVPFRSEEHTSELQSQSNLVCRLLLEKKKKINNQEDRQKNNPRLRTSHHT